MLTLYFTPGACSMAAHIVLEESGENYEAKKVDLADGEQRTEAYLKINPLGRVPALLLDNGEPLAENTAILPFLGKRFDLWPEDALAEAKALWLIGFFASNGPHDRTACCQTRRGRRTNRGVNKHSALDLRLRAASI
jgi:glutathione S-transferase